VSDDKAPKGCATCGCDAIMTTSFKLVEGEIRLDRQCMTCKTTWTEFYKFYGLMNYTPGK
jgi:ArsR family metal-binding transcriptional regulator